jgi:predicted PurR-regulated permease PerM
VSWLKRVRDQARERLAAARLEGAAPPTVVVVHDDAPGAAALPAKSPANDTIPVGLRIAAGWAWRVILLVAGLYVVFWLVSLLRVVVIPIAVALLLSALLEPVAGALRRRGAPRSLAAITVLVLGLLVVGGVLTLVIQAFIDGLPDLTSQVSTALTKSQDWLANSRFHIKQDEVNGYVDDAKKWLSAHSSSLTSGALSTATTLGEVVTGFFLVLFSTFFFLKDGSQIWGFVTKLLPRPAQAPVRTAGYYSWHTLTSYVRATVLVAFVDALGIGVGLSVLHVPLMLPLAALVFMGAFIPVVGATLSGAVAVAVTLVAQGPVDALIILAVVIGVQQLEAHVLQPLIMGRAVSLHPLAVILAIAIGIVVAGIVGGLVAVPLLAVSNTAIRYLVSRPDGGPAPGGADAPPGTRPTDDDEAAAERTSEKVDEARQDAEAGEPVTVGAATPEPAARAG